jgi:hypothetical protein
MRPRSIQTTYINKRENSLKMSIRQEEKIFVDVPEAPEWRDQYANSWTSYSSGISSFINEI